MKSFSKIASVILALVMMLTVCVMPTSAASDTELDITYTVVKDAENSDEDTDVYALTISVEAGVNNIAMLNIPIVYDSTLFTPSSMKSGHGGAIKYTTKMSGQYKYPAFVGIGEFNAEVDYDFEEDGVTINPDWEGGVSPAGAATLESSVANASNLGSLDQSKYGCVYFVFEFADATRYIVAGEKVDLVTFYFFTDAGTDVTGAEFGTIGDSTLPAGTFETTGDLYYSGSDYVFADIAKVNVSNAVVEAAAAEPSPVYAKTSQIRYNSAETNGKGSANFDVRTRAAMTAADFALKCGTDAEAVKNIDAVGFVYADASVAFDMNAAKAAVAAGATTGAYVYKEVEHIQKTGTEYVWTCLITFEDGMYDDAVNSLAFITVNGETYFFDAEYATDFSVLYDAQSSHLPTA